MPWIIDYRDVLEQMQRDSMRCLYFNSGAFDLIEGSPRFVRGWLGPEDGTILPAARALARNVPAPFEANLAEAATQAWLTLLPGTVWVMPKSHWSYELDFGSRDWLPAVLEHIEVDSGQLQSRTNGAALVFEMSEADRFKHLIEKLLQMLLGSDFAFAFPGRGVYCTVHHHKQLWWTVRASETIDQLDALLDRPATNKP